MRKRKTGEVYTPFYVVDQMLDLVGYNSNSIIKKHVIDNSCGKGAFLLRVVDRYINIAKKSKYSDKEIIKQLETYVHGIELNENSYLETLKNLNSLVKEKGLVDKVKWNILNKNALEVSEFDNKMDYVVGNPPYIRIHDLDFDYKKYEFSKKGMTDLYIIFFEIGIKMLADKAKLAYITPRSFTTSRTGNKLREYIIENNLLEKIMDFKHENPFENISTYPIVTILNKNKPNKNIVVYDSKLENEFYINDNDYYINGGFYFVNQDDIKFLKDVLSTKDVQTDIYVRNGLATNADWFFYNNEYKGRFIVKAIKASTGSETNLFYPYKNATKIHGIDEIEVENKEMYDKLIENMDELNKRDLEKNKEWYGFARSQAINDVDKDKLAISTIVKNVDSIKINPAPAGVAVYSGLYIYSSSFSLEQIKEVILSENFIKYVSLLSNLKRGEYYNFSSRDLSTYLNYVFSEEKRG